MQKTLGKILFSTRLMAILFLVFAAAMAVGTFVEDAHGTPAARIWIYNTWWFEAIMVFFMINFVGNIVRYRLYKKEKWATLLLHLSFILILLGSFITRYIGYEGSMPIREGETTNQFLSQKTYFTLFMDGNYKGEPRRRVVSEEMELSQATQGANQFTIKTDFDGQEVEVRYVDFISGAELGLIPQENGAGDLYLKLVEAGGGQRHDHYLKEGEVANIHNILVAFNQQTAGAINILYREGQYFIKSPFEGTFMRMADQFQGAVAKDSLQPLQLRSLYNTAGMQFVIPDPVVRGEYGVVPIETKEKGQQDALTLDITTKGETERITLLGGMGFFNDMKKIKLGGLDMYLSFGSKKMELPFSIKLNDFIAEKYPGTEKAYKSYMSKVEIVDDGTSEPYDIYMNHVLDYEGYRFFQSSFMPDESGSVLSVNHDFWGTWFTYVGYFLLYAGLLLILFTKGSRFKDLENLLDKVRRKKKTVIATSVLVIGVVSAMAQESQEPFDSLSPDMPAQHSELQVRPTKKQLDSLILANAVSKEHAESFGRVVIQDEGGRMKPANTFSSELLRKLSGKDTYQGMTSDQVFISMIENPIVWYNIPIIELTRGNDSIRKIIGVHKKEKAIALVDLFDQNQQYKLAPYLEAASSTNTPNQIQKDLLRTHEKFYLLESALSGGVLRIFPVPEDENNKWVSPPAVNEVNYKGMDSVYTRQIIPIYRNSLVEARKSGDYTNPDKFVKSIQNFQKKYGSAVLPSEEKIESEILLNTYDPFRNLYMYYALVGILMIVFIIIQIFKERKWVRYAVNTCMGLVILLFVVHTAALATRWYVSGHAPWSDAYESMIYVAWATLGIGLGFSRRSNLTVAATTFVAAVILAFAHQNWTDPAIANLQPVLDSYWIMIHVSIIVGSYGPFFVGAILGVLALILMILTTEDNKKRMDLNIRELTIVNEMALTIGLVMLTIGNFLGAQWANESWGRYWGWDPKETWALISIMIYAFVIHMRLVPGLRSRWWFNLASVLAVSSILMTYFGVNFYLKGLHSYASGDKVVTPSAIYYALIAVSILGAVSFWRYQQFYSKKK